MSRQIGPGTTSHLQQMEQCSPPTAKRHGVSKADVVEPESSDTEDELYGPTLPPDMLAARNASKPRVLGPSRPNPTQHDVTKPAQHVSIIDDEYGPVPLPVDQLEAQVRGHICNVVFCYQCGQLYVNNDRASANAKFAVGKLNYALQAAFSHSQ